jgi:hypothetical protein
MNFAVIESSLKSFLYPQSSSPAHKAASVIIDHHDKPERNLFGLLLWSSDFHISPVADVKTVLSM